MKRIVLQSPQELNTISLGSTLAFDFETTDEKNRKRMFNDSDYKNNSGKYGLWYTTLVPTGISFCDGEQVVYLSITPDNHEQSISEISKLLGKTKRLIAHNISFDGKILRKYNISFENKKLFDTMIAHHLLDENDHHSLKYLTEKILGIKSDKYENAGSNHYTKRFYEYGLNDAYYTWLLFDKFINQIHNEGLDWLFYNIEMPYQHCLIDMEVNGMQIDQNLYKKYKEDMKQELLKAETNMYDYIGVPYNIQTKLDGSLGITNKPINFNSPQQVIKIFQNQGIEITETTDNGNPSVGKATIAKNIENEFVKLYDYYKKLSKLYTAFIEPLSEHLQNNGKIRSQFKDTGTKTGRLSSISPNLQQLPNSNSEIPFKLRELFIAPKGYKMFTCDYSGQEIAVAAQVSKDETLVDSLNNGYDMHLAIANQFFNLGIPKEYLNKTHENYEKVREQYDDSRKKAKTITFGLMYGKSAYGFSHDFGITEEEAQQIVDKYFEGMPGLKKAIDNTHQQLKDNGFVKNLVGRKRRFKKVTKTNPETGEKYKAYPGNAYRQSFNFKIQGTSADMIRIASIRVRHYAKEHPEWDLQQIASIHDEICFIVKEEYVKKATAVIKEQFEKAANFTVPIKADISVGNNYEEAK